MDASADRWTRTLVGLRPYRPSGFVVRTDVLDGKPITEGVSPYAGSDVTSPLAAVITSYSIHYTKLYEPGS